MRILRVFNNNVVLANHSGTEVVLTGRGLGFGASAGDPVDESKVVRMFVPEDHREPDHVAALAADIPPWYVELAGSLTDHLEVPSPTVLALGDHLHMAVRRQELGALTDSHPLGAEVRHLYPKEFATAGDLLIG